MSQSLIRLFPCKKGLLLGGRTEKRHEKGQVCRSTRHTVAYVGMCRTSKRSDIPGLFRVFCTQKFSRQNWAVDQVQVRAVERLWRKQKNILSRRPSAAQQTIWSQKIFELSWRLRAAGIGSILRRIGAQRLLQKRWGRGGRDMLADAAFCNWLVSMQGNKIIYCLYIYCLYASSIVMNR